MGASDIRQELSEYHTYLTLACALHDHPDGKLELLRKLLNEVAFFVGEATSKDLKGRGKELVQGLKSAVESHAKFLPRRKPPRQIARDFLDLSTESDVWRFGIPHEWLQDRFESSGIRAAPDLPPHAKVGIGVHAGHASVEEAFLLEDTYFLLARAEAAFNRMHTTAKVLRESQGNQIDETAYKLLAVLNGEVGTFSRLSVVSSAAFVEAFVNSVGWAESTGRRELGEEVRTQLRGAFKGRYLALEAKLERYPKLIRADGSTPIVLSDKKQAKEPFVSFLAETKELRDASMHYAPGKAMIWRPPQEWLASAQRAAEYAVRVAEAFWSACYPSKGLPKYLDGLHHSRFLERARERVKRADDTTDSIAP